MAEQRQIQISQPSTGEEELEALREPLETGWLTHGPKVSAFEKAFAARHAVPHAMAVTSATAGLHLALVALGIGPGDEVIVPAFTWVSTANVVIYCGATPVLVDVERSTFNIDIEDVARKLSPRTKAVIAVHLFGLCVDIPRLRRYYPRLLRSSRTLRVLPAVITTGFLPAPSAILAFSRFTHASRLPPARGEW